MTFFNKHAQAVRGFLTGFLLVFSAHIILELWPSLRALTLALLLILFAVWCARRITNYFHHKHHGEMEDAAVHIFAPGLLLLVNIFHPIIDGFSVVETFERGGVVIGIVAVLGVALHEIVRQWALIIALRKIEFKRAWLVVVTAALGIIAGLALGIIGSHFTYRHEMAVDLITLSAYVFIIAEFWYADHGPQSKKQNWVTAILGIVVAVLFSLFFSGH